MKLKALSEPSKEYEWIAANFVFECPGCKCLHGVWTTRRNKNSAIWSFNGSMEKPTFSPSLLITWHDCDGNKRMTCHSFVRDGKIEFLNDCTHELKGQTIELPEIE